MQLYITIAGHKHYFGLLPFYVGCELFLQAEPDNLYDSEAIAVYSTKYGKVGYVAQNDETRAGGTIPASILFPLAKKQTAIVCFIAGDYVIAEIKQQRS